MDSPVPGAEMEGMAGPADEVGADAILASICALAALRLEVGLDLG